MMCNQSKAHTGRKNANNISVETVCGSTVRLVFAAETDCKIPEIVGQILKGAYRQRQRV